MAIYDEQPEDMERQLLLDGLAKKPVKPTPLNLDDYTRRGGGTGGAFTGALGGAGLGATIGSVVPGVGSAIGAGVGAVVGGIRGAFTKHADSAPTDYLEADARDAIGKTYQERLGRAASESELNDQLRGQGWQSGDRYVGAGGLESVLSAVRGSQEAKDYKARPPVVAPPTTPTDPAAPTGTSDYRALGQYANRLQGVERSKFDRPYDELSEKYKVALVNSHFDPSKGIHQPGYLEALNALGIADYAGEDDRLRVSNGRNGARYGAGGQDDTIVNYTNDGNPEGAMWGNWTSQEEQARRRAAQAAPQGAPQGPVTASSSSTSLMPSDPAFQQSLLAKLMAALGGNDALDRDTLLRELS